MPNRILDLDGGLARQTQLLRNSGAVILRLQEWGRNLRLACRHGALNRFEKHLSSLLGSSHDTQPFLTFVGSGDFHHVSLALLRRLTGPFNLLVIDKHPDWMRGIPFLHCGTWLYHAACLPNVQRIFHLGGALDFDNVYRWLAPWPMIRSGKIVVAPACQRFRGRAWDRIAHQPLRPNPEEPLTENGLQEWLNPYRSELAAHPLYISLDKDVLTASEAVVNWDSGYLTEMEVMEILSAFVSAAEGQLAGMDVVGDWSSVRLRGWMRRLLHWTEHPTLSIDANEATRRNQGLNLRVLEWIYSISSALPLFRRERDLLFRQTINRAHGQSL